MTFIRRPERAEQIWGLSRLGMHVICSVVVGDRGVGVWRSRSNIFDRFVEIVVVAIVVVVVVDS